MLKKLESLLVQEINKIPRPFGIFLSGGIDSGLLAALAKPDFAVTCNFKGDKYDELAYAGLITKYLKIPLKVLQPTKEHFKNNIDEAIKIIGKPINSVSIFPWYCLMKESQGKTMISGEGADELFGGYSRYLMLKQVYELYKVPELKNYYKTLDFLFKDIHSKLIEIDVPFSTDMEDAMRYEFKNTLPDIILMEKKMAKHFNVDLHQPFMSKAIQEFANKLSLDYKIKGFTTKWILRELAREYLPGRIYKRVSKSGLICPVNKWMGWDGERGEFDKKMYMDYQREILNI